METTTRARGTQHPGALAENAHRVKQQYTHGEDKPLGSHLILVVIYNALVGLFFFFFFFFWRARSGRSFPERVGAGDLLMAGVATHKLSRIVSKDRVTAPLRAPFTEFQEE